MDAVTFRHAVESDAAAGARLHITCWREAYAPYVDADRLEQRLFDVDGREQLWLRVIEGGHPWLLAEHEGELVGFAHAGPAGTDEPAPRQLYALYTRAAWWGLGLGQDLLDRVLAPGPCALWVLEDNPRARGFYARNGFVADGARELDEQLDAWQVRLVRTR